MKQIAKYIVTGLLATTITCQATAQYTPSAENLRARQEFADNAFGIFIHWGIYSMFGQGEWFLQQSGITAKEYAKAARGFYPADFDAAKWVKTFKDAGAKYICITTRHHDGFSMFHTAQSPYNIVDGTPFGRDIIGEIADECHRQGMKLHLYYSHADWTREDYPIGDTGHNTGRDTSKNDWNSYYNFMNAQLTELLTNYGEIGAIWFDGIWDKPDFDWQLEEQYALIHSLQSGCLVGNNHHHAVKVGEDIQIFEKDLPGENNSGFSPDAVVSDQLPLETCETICKGWGYKVTNQQYKDTRSLIHLLVKAAGMGANLLLNVGPQPNGEIPEEACMRLAEIGQWTSKYGETIYSTTRGDVYNQPWGTTTRKGDKLFVHVLTPETSDIELPINAKVKKATAFDDRSPVKFTTDKRTGTTTLHLSEIPTDIDYIVELQLASK